LKTVDVLDTMADFDADDKNRYRMGCSLHWE